MPICARQSDVDSGAVREIFSTCPVIAGRSLNAGTAAEAAAGKATAAKPATVVVTTVATAARDTIEMSFIGTSRAGQSGPAHRNRCNGVMASGRTLSATLSRY